MNDQTCKTCFDNEDGFCDRKGILVEDDDHCSSWRGMEAPDRPRYQIDRLCGTCRWFEEYAGVCTNGSSPYRGEFMWQDDDGCEEWEGMQ